MPDKKPTRCTKTPHQNTHLGALCHVCARKCAHAGFPTGHNRPTDLATDHRRDITKNHTTPAAA